MVVYRTPSPAPPVLEETPRRRVRLTDRPVGDSLAISSIFPTGPQFVEVIVPEPLPTAALSRSTSNASSYMYSHHSDDDLFDDIEESSILSPVHWPEELSVEPSTPHVTSSSSISSSPLSPSTLSSEATTVMQQAPEVLQRALQGIRDQLRALEDGQAAARNLLESLQERPEDHTGELAERLQRIEGLIQNLLDQGHPRGPEIIYQPPVSPRTTSISESTDSLQRLRSILRDLATPADIETRHMPLPTTALAGPSVAQQLDEILSSAHVPSTTPAELPRIEPFVYRPSGRGARARSESPSSIELPPRPQTVPIYFPITTPGRPPTRLRRRQEPSEPEDITLHAPPTRPRPSDAERQRIPRDEGRERPPIREDFNVGRGPPPQPVMVRFYSLKLF